MILSLSLILFGQLFFSLPSQAVGKSLPKLFYPKDQIERSCQFMRLSDGKILYQENPHKLLIPASVMKLVTSAAVLEQWGPQEKIHTPVYHTGQRKGFKILGDLVIKGQGDPLIISEKLWQFAADLRHLGIREISGDLYIDNSLFDDQWRDQARKHSRLASTHAYDAPITAFGVNFNTYTVAMAPGNRPGAKALASLDPYPLRTLQIDNQVSTWSESQGSSLRLSRVSQKGASAVMVARGGMGLSAPLKKIYRSVGDPVKAAGEIVRAFLNKEDIILQGQIKEGTPKSTGQKLYAIEGYPLKKIVESLNKYSNNYIADVLLKKLGAATSPPGSMEKGILSLQKFMTQKVEAEPGYIIQNGSGLDPRNRLNASQLVKLMAFMERRYDLFPEYLASLPAAGFDGTLDDRFQTKATRPWQGYVRAKTGSLTAPVSVASLAGYARHPKHGLVAFAVIENGKSGKGQPSLIDLRASQDQALSRFLNSY